MSNSGNRRLTINIGRIRVHGAGARSPRRLREAIVQHLEASEPGGGQFPGDTFAAERRAPHLPRNAGTDAISKAVAHAVRSAISKETT